MNKRNLCESSMDESKERLEFILECAKGGDWDLDLETGKAVTSFRHDRCFGASEPISDWNYEKFLSYVHPDDREREDKKFQEAVNSGTDWSIDCRVVWDDGSIHWIQSSGRNYRYVDGRPTRMLGMVREVTEQKLLEQSLRESRNQLQNIFENAPAAIALLEGPSHKFVLANLQYQKLVNRTKDRLFGKTVMEVFPELEGKKITEFLDYVYKTKESFTTKEYPAQYNKYDDGRLHQSYFHITAEPLKDDGGNVISIMLIAYDITEQIEGRKKVEESHQKIRNLIAQAPVAMCLYGGPTFIVEIINSKMLAIWGKSLEAVINKPVYEAMPESKSQGFEDLLKNVYSTGESFTANEITITLLRNGKKEELYVNLLYQPFTENDGTISGIVEIAHDVTEQVRSRQKVEESEEKFRAAILAVEGVIWTNNGNGEMEGEQPGWADLTGQRLEEYQGYGWAKAVHPDDAQPTIEAWNEAVKHKITFEFKHRVKTKYGQWRNYSIRAVPVLNTDGSLRQWVGVHTDITESLNAQIAIQESEERFRTFGNNIQNLAWLADGDGNIFWYNQRWLDYTGLTLDEMKGWGWQKVHHPDHVEHILDISKNLWVTDEPFELTFPLKRADGVYRWFLTRGVPVKNTEGKIYQWVGTNTDINDLVEAEEKLKQSENLLQNIFKNAPAAFALLEGDSLKYKLANAGYQKMVNRSEEQLIGKAITEVFPELEGSAIVGFFETIYKTGERFTASEYPALLDKFGDGVLHPYFFNLTAEPLKDAEGKVTSVIVIANDITEQIDARRKIEESEQRYHRLIHSSPSAIAILYGEDLVITIANEPMIEVWGKGKDIIGKKYFEALPELAAQGYREIFAEVYKTGIPFNSIETPVTILQNGEITLKYYNFILYAQRNANNQIDGIGIIATEVTSQVIFHNKIKEREEKFSSLVQALPQLVWVTDAQGNAEFASFRWKDYTGLEPGGEKEWKAIVHPDDYDNINKAWAHSLTSGDSYVNDVRLKSKEGEYRWHTVTGVPVINNSGTIEKWVGAFTDTHVERTFSKELEEKVIMRTAELKESEEKFYTLFNTSPICTTLSEVLSDKIIMVNDAFTNVFGFSRDELLSKTLAELGMIESDTHEIISNEIKSYGNFKNKEIILTNKSGQKFVTLASAEIIRVGAKEFILDVYNDITDRKKVEQHIEQKNNELEKMNKELQSFAYISSHDLQEPLRKIQTFATRIVEKEENNLSHYGKDMLNRMQDAAKRMQQLIEDLLLYSRTNTEERKFETTNLNRIVEEVKEDLQEEINLKKATIHVKNLSDVSVIPFQFRQLLQNLISNALKFSNPEKTPHIEIRSEIGKGMKFNSKKLQPLTSYCCITVSDNGIGFDQQYGEKIFDVFQRLHGKAYNGTGIGLSIVKKIVENHNGIITATGEPGNGATFEIFIPN